MACIIRSTPAQIAARAKLHPDDRQILHSINDEMKHDHRVKNIDISVSVARGVVTLIGWAASFEDKWAAGEVALRAGAEHVRNEILVL